MEIILKYFSEFTQQQIGQLKALDALYKEWNEKINVISRKDIDGLYEKHVLHSLSIAAVFDFPAQSRIIDLGTGGGFPGIPLAIYFPEVQFHLVDSIAKKLKVVDGIAHELNLTNISTQHIRVEEIRGRHFDFVVSRAVAPLKDLWKWSKPLLKKTNAGSKLQSQVPGIQHSTPGIQDPESGLICLKGGDLTAEIHESGLRPYITDIHDIFPETFFLGKYILYNPI